MSTSPLGTLVEPSAGSTSPPASLPSLGAKMRSRCVRYDFAVVIQTDRFDDGIDPTTWLI